MNLKSKILTLKSIKIGFDIVFILMSLFVLYFIVSTTYNFSDLSSKSIVRVAAKAELSKPILDKSIVLKSKMKDTKVISVVNSYDLFIGMKSIDIEMPIVFRIIYLFTLNLGLFFILFIAFHLRNILNSIIKGLRDSERRSLQNHIFDYKNIRRFRYIAYGFILMPLIELSLYFTDSYFLSRYFEVNGFELKPMSGLIQISWDYIFIGLFFIAFIEIIRRGINIQEENDLTV